jgi:Dolichyl-phosphate-mannose-protein mannosyltransferase
MQIRQQDGLPAILCWSQPPMTAADFDYLLRFSQSAQSSKCLGPIAFPSILAISLAMRISLASLIATLLLIYQLNGRPHPEVDCVAAPYTAWSLVCHASLDLRGDSDLLYLVGDHIGVMPDGSWVSIRPPGSALAAIPVVAPFAIFREHPLPAPFMNQLGKLAAACSVAIAAALFFVVCRRLAPTSAWPATILFSLGTCLCSVASQALWMHGPATMWLCLSLFVLTRGDADRAHWNAAAGLGLGIAILTRPTTMFFALATAVALLTQRRWRATLLLSLGVAIPVACLCLLNWLEFGNPILGGYANENWQEAPPWWLGLGGLLIAPSRGVLVYSPALILVPLGVWKLLGRENTPLHGVRSLLVAWLAAAGATLLFYARWHDWRGGWCYGPRFLCETMPILCLAFAFAYEKLQTGWQRRFAVALVGLSVVVHLVGIFGYKGYEDWQVRHQLPDQGRCLFAFHDTQIEAHAKALAHKLFGI